jgi:hypothetical protein
MNISKSVIIFISVVHFKIYICWIIKYLLREYSSQDEYSATSKWTFYTPSRSIIIIDFH